MTSQMMVRLAVCWQPVCHRPDSILDNTFARQHTHTCWDTIHCRLPQTRTSLFQRELWKGEHAADTALRR